MVFVLNTLYIIRMLYNLIYLKYFIKLFLHVKFLHVLTFESSLLKQIEMFSSMVMVMYHYTDCAYIFKPHKHVPN